MNDKVYITDASIVEKWFFDEILSKEARRILFKGNYLYAPDFILMELDSVFCKRIKRGEITHEDSEDARTLLKQLPIEYYPFASFQNMAYGIAIQTQQSIYDCLYIALAALLDGRMVTADRRLYAGLVNGPLGKYLLWVGDCKTGTS